MQLIKDIFKKATNFVPNSTKNPGREITKNTFGSKQKRTAVQSEHGEKIDWRTLKSGGPKEHLLELGVSKVMAVRWQGQTDWPDVKKAVFCFPGFPTDLYRH